jgi:hypothetical protein
MVTEIPGALPVLRDWGSSHREKNAWASGPWSVPVTPVSWYVTGVPSAGRLMALSPVPVLPSVNV